MSEITPTTPQVMPSVSAAEIQAGIVAAAERYRRRRDRKEKPDGRFDRAGRWYPAATENYSGQHRRPSRAWPLSLLLACRTIKHCARMHGVEEHLSEVRRRIREMDKAAKIQGGGLS